MSTVILRDIGGIEIDAVLSENHDSSLGITRNPVERGADITDHAYLMPKSCTLNAAISEYPFRGRGTINAEPGGGRVQAAWEQLVELQESRKPFDIVTGFSLYENMLIERLSATRDDKTNNVLNFTADLVEVRLVTTSYSSEQIPSLKARDKSTLGDEGTKDRASPTEGRGDVSLEPASRTDESVLSSLFGGELSTADAGL